MTDPAIQAAKRVLDMWVNDTWDASRHFIAEAAAREALAPLRARHRAAYGFRLPRREGDRPEAFCEACQVRWPCDDARDIYPEDEL